MNDKNKQTASSLSLVASHEPLHNTKYAADFIGCAERTLMCWRVNGSGPRYVKLGAGKKAAVRYRMSDILAWVEAQGRENTAQEREV
jgi:predicted DNA-binding transcriptional regulator AlpA